MSYIPRSISTAITSWNSRSVRNSGSLLPARLATGVRNSHPSVSSPVLASRICALICMRSHKGSCKKPGHGRQKLGSLLWAMSMQCVRLDWPDKNRIAFVPDLSVQMTLSYARFCSTHTTCTQPICNLRYKVMPPSFNFTQLIRWKCQGKSINLGDLHPSLH